MLFPPAGCTTIGSLVLFARSAASFAAFLVLNLFLLAIGRLLSFPADNTVLSLDRRHIFGSEMGSALQGTRHWYPVWTLPYPSCCTGILPLPDCCCQPDWWHLRGHYTDRSNPSFHLLAAWMAFPAYHIHYKSTLHCVPFWRAHHTASKLTSSFSGVMI